MHYFFGALFLLATTNAVAQTNSVTPKLRYAHFQLPLSAGDTAQVLITGKPDAAQKKGVFLFVHGSMPTPLALFQDTIAYGVFPFKTTGFENQYHFVAVSKPGLPLMAQIKDLDQRMCFNDPKTGRPPALFLQNNHLDYFVEQHAAVLDWLLRQPWVDPSRVIVCGGSQGATVASKLASVSPRVTHLIYYSGNPNGGGSAYSGGRGYSENFRGSSRQKVRGIAAVLGLVVCRCRKPR